jgi:2-dehydro-3-deoxygalactonokinase
MMIDPREIAPPGETAPEASRRTPYIVMAHTSQRHPSENHPVLLALDWGTTILRAYLMAATGAVLEMRHAPRGILRLPASPDAGGFEQAFAEIAGDWLRSYPTLKVVAGGMVGSAQGWIEAPYARAPADVRALAAHAVRVPSGLGPEVLIAPGVILDAPDRSPDVMRGEEIQIAGAVASEPSLAERTCFVLPGTHSKWVFVEEQRIVNFATHMTGELYAVLREHSILGRLISTEPADPAASELGFAQGLAAARASSPGDLPQQLFATRTLGLTQRLPKNALADYLSGLLIGHELVSGLAASRTAREAGAPLVLIGDAALCRRYARALATFDIAVHAELDNTAPRGLWELARAAGLLI